METQIIKTAFPSDEEMKKQASDYADLTNYQSVVEATEESYIDGAKWMRGLQLLNYRGWSKNNLIVYGIVCATVGMMLGLCLYALVSSLAK